MNVRIPYVPLCANAADVCLKTTGTCLRKLGPNCKRLLSAILSGFQLLKLFIKLFCLTNNIFITINVLKLDIQISYDRCFVILNLSLLSDVFSLPSLLYDGVLTVWPNSLPSPEALYDIWMFPCSVNVSEVFRSENSKVRLTETLRIFCCA